MDKETLLAIKEMLLRKQRDYLSFISPPGGLEYDKLEKWKSDPWQHHQDDTIYYGEWRAMQEALRQIDRLLAQ